MTNEKHSIKYWLQFIKENNDDVADFNFGFSKIIETAIALEEENKELKEQIADLQKYTETLSENYENEIEEHKKVIEKMKCCANCKFDWAQVACVSPNKCKDMDKWELIE